MPTDSAAPRAGPPDDIRAGPLNDEIAGPPGESAGIDARRRELRRAALARRAALTPEEHARRSRAICEHLLARFPELAGRRVGFCWPVRNEPDVRPALEAWRAAGRPGFAALLPVVVQKAAALAFREWRPGAPLTEDLHGIPAPAAGRVLAPQALLIPLAAFDADGYRLGYGGGYFDRTLAATRPRPLAIGIAFDLARTKTTHPQPHDERLDAVVTESGVTMFAV